MGWENPAPKVIVVHPINSNFSPPKEKKMPLPFLSDFETKVAKGRKKAREEKKKESTHKKKGNREEKRDKRAIYLKSKVGKQRHQKGSHCSMSLSVSLSLTVYFTLQHITSSI